MNTAKKIIPSIFFTLITLLSATGYCQSIREVKGHIHEAFMTVETEQNILYTAIPLEPPAPLDEQTPSQEDPQAVWVAGYWEWLPEQNDFVWCSGSWRRPPPGHVWIEGYWKYLSAGWIRLRGFWSEDPESQLAFISVAPPSAINENPSSRPGNDYFWMSGYWSFLSQKRDYNWLGGKWEKLDPNWIYVPAHYAWRPEGYTFVAAYWDWPIEDRGTAYACVSIPQNRRSDSYTPTMIVEPLQIIEDCLLYYPDYYYFYCHHYYFHIDWWWDYAWCPPWWAWDWWWFSWDNQWALWWWWTHPGFPAPIWLLEDILALLFAPGEDLILAMQNIHPPLIITPLGVVSPDALLDELSQISGPNAPPIFPTDPSSIQDQVGRDTPEGRPLLPTGPKVPLPDLDRNPIPLPPINPGRTPPQTTRPAPQPSLPDLPSTVVTPPKPSTPSYPQRPRPPLQTYPPSRPIQPPTQTYPPTRPIKPPSQTYPPSRPRPPSQAYPPTRPIKPPSQTYPPTAPTQPPTQTYPPSQSVSPSQTYPRPTQPSAKPTLRYNPQQQYIPPSQQQFRPQTPLRQTQPSQAPRQNSKIQQ